MKIQFISLSELCGRGFHLVLNGYFYWLWEWLLLFAVLFETFLTFLQFWGELVEVLPFFIRKLFKISLEVEKILKF